MALVLPTLPGVSWPRDVTFGNFNTTVQTSVSNISTFLPNAIQPRRRYVLNISGLDASGANPGLLTNSFQTLQGFFNQCYGRALSFQYVDPDDTQATAQQFGISDGITVTYQLVRALGGFVENVFAPAAAPQVFSNGVSLVPGTDFTVNLNTGAVTFLNIPASGAVLTWTGTYAWWCNFDDDKLNLPNIFSGIYEARDVGFTTRVF